QALFMATKKIDLKMLKSQGEEAVYSALAELQKPIAAYFEVTMVNADDEQVKNNRYMQLHMIDKLIAALGDLEQIVIK
ncbi:MAG: glycine--tRNA ligase subunit beta, partial [Leuconostoc gelidum]